MKNEREYGGNIRVYFFDNNIEIDMFFERGFRVFLRGRGGGG